MSKEGWRERVSQRARPTQTSRVVPGEVFRRRMSKAHINIGAFVDEMVLPSFMEVHLAEDSLRLW